MIPAGQEQEGRRAPSSLGLFKGTPRGGNPCGCGTQRSRGRLPVQAKAPVLIQSRQLLICSLWGLRSSETKGQRNEARGFRAASKVQTRARHVPAPPVRDPPQCPHSPVWTCCPHWGLPPTSSHPVGHRAGTGPQRWPRAVASVCGGCLAGLEHADLEGRLQRLICLLRHFAGGRRCKQAEFHLSPAVPPAPQQRPSCWSY